MSLFMQNLASVMPGLEHRRTHGMALVETDGAAEANQRWHMSRRGSLRCRSAEPPETGDAQGLLTAASLALRVAEKQLSSARHKNESLRIQNERLMQSLADASRQAVAAVRVAHHDTLTGLPNRLLLIRRLQRGISNAFQRHHQLALLFIDLDGFKVVNDRFGHAVADRLLTIVAARFAACVRAGDLACRYGGDEFIALLTNIKDAAVAVGIAEKIRERLGQRYMIDGNEVHITASIGLAVYPADGERYDALLNCADAAMYRDKAARRARAASCGTAWTTTRVAG